jgi:hypothetical protein
MPFSLMFIVVVTKQNLPEVANHRAATNGTKGTSVGLLRFTRFLHASAPSQDVSLKL